MAAVWRDRHEIEAEAEYRKRLDTYKRGQKAHRKLARAERRAARKARRNRG